MIATIVVFVISQTNVYQKSIEVAEDISNKSSMLFAADKDSKENKPDPKKIQEVKKNERELFENVRAHVNVDEIRKNEVDGVSEIARYLYVNNLGTKDEEVEDVARRLYKKLVSYEEVKEVDIVGVLIIIVLAFFLPEGFLYIRSHLVKYYIYNEYLQLEVTAIMVGKLDPIKVEEILNVLSDNSKYFKRYIDEIRFNYFDVKEGHGKAFDSIISRITHKELRYLMKSLQQAAESDLKMTIENLENQRKSNKEFRNIREQNKLKQKELIGILVILFVLAQICYYAFTPFLSIMNNFNI